MVGGIHGPQYRFLRCQRMVELRTQILHMFKAQVPLHGVSRAMWSYLWAYIGDIWIII